MNVATFAAAALAALALATPVATADAQEPGAQAHADSLADVRGAAAGARPATSNSGGARRATAVATGSARAADATGTRADPEVDAGGVRPLSVAKWGSTAATAAAAVYGFSASLTADDHYARIERLCAEDASRCASRDADGGYLDPEIARLDEEASRLDRRARLALLASQVGVAASVVLFVLDLRNPGAPPNLPYIPSKVRVDFGAGGALRLRARVPVP